MTSAAPASTPTTIPLESTASAAAAQAVSIQRRSAGDRAGEVCARVKASTAAVRKKLKAPSRRLMCPTMRKNGLTASAVRASRAAAPSYRRATHAKVSGRHANASPTLHNRELHSLTPKTSYAIAVAQYWSGGFSKYRRPSKRGVTQSPLASISRGISAYRPSSGSRSGRTGSVANHASASSTQAAQPGRPVLPASTSPLMPRARPPLAGASDARHRRRARAEAFLLHVELDGAADGRVHVGARTPSEVALRRLDVGHAHLDVLVVLAVVLAGGHIDDLGGTGVVAQHRELLCDPDGALGEIADRDAIGRVADVEYAPAGAPVLVPENGQEALDGVVDVREGACLAAAVD